DSHVPSAIDSAYFPGQVIAGDGRLRRRFSHTGHGPFRARIVSNLKWGGPCRGHYVFPQADIKSSAILSSRRIAGISYFPQTLSSSAAPNHDNLPPGRKTYIHTPPSRPLAVPAAFYGNAGTGKTKAVFTDEDTEEEILDTALADDTTVTISPVRTNSISEIMTEAITG
uniref:hypothetical protein n=1 Tax=Clostridium symbiosum TaxID=1512 RepID=UPI0034A2877F